MRMKEKALGLALLISIMGCASLFATEAGADGPLAPTIRYVDDDPGSTYSTIQDALDNATAGDTIYVANGTYTEFVTVTQSDLMIIGNSTDNVILTGSGGTTFYINGVTNVTVSGMNITSSDSLPVYIYDSDNITLSMMTMWSGGDYSGALFIKDSEDISVAGDFWTFTPVTLHSEGDANPAVKLDNTKRVALFIVDLFTDGDGAHGVAGYTGNIETVVIFDDIVLSGTASDAFYFQNTVLGGTTGVSATYTGELVDIDIGTFMVIDYTVPDADVNVGTNALVANFFNTHLEVTDENDMPVQGVDMKMENDLEGVVYETPYFGGTDDTTDSFGEIDDLMLLAKYYPGSNTPNYGENDMDIYYDGGDVPVEMSMRVDANTTDTILVTLDDFDAPGEATNVGAETISHVQIDLYFEASPAADIDHYQVWVDAGAGFEWDFNTTVPGTFPYMDLEPATEYGFRVIAVDDDGLTSDGVVVTNTTEPPVNGSLEGKVTYEGGPMDGDPAEGATVTLLNTTSEVIRTRTLNETGMYMFEEVPFGTGYTLQVEPAEPVTVGGIESGYVREVVTFDHTEPSLKNVTVGYYAYISDDIHGVVTYGGGPMDGMNATNATVILYNETMIEIASTTTGENGSYLLEEVPFGDNYTLKVTPVDAVEEGGTASGYVAYVSETFHHMMETQMDAVLDYHAYVSDDIHGMVVYDQGPMDGMNATNATVILYNETMIEMANTTVDANGSYVLEDVPFGTNYTLKVTPVDAVGEGGTVSGYIVHMSDPFNHTGELTMDVDITYYEYTEPAPTSGPLTGTISYGGGPRDGEAVEGATVSLMQDGEYIMNATTNGTGDFIFEDVEFGTYTLMITPPAADLGEEGVRSGYLPVSVAGFDLQSDSGLVKDAALTYYEHTVPEPVHPTLTILDGDGNPLEDVKVTVTVGEDTYEATTDENGEATFTDFEGESFPDGAMFEAELEGYGTIEWEQGQAIPRMEEDEEEETDNTMVYIIVAVVILIILLALFFMFRKKEEEPFSEE